MLGNRNAEENSFATSIVVDLKSGRPEPTNTLNNGGNRSPEQTGNGVAGNRVGGTDSPTTAIMTTTTPTQTPSRTPPDIVSSSPPTKGLATGAIVGIAVGIGLLAILLGLVMFFVIRRKKLGGRKESYGGDPSEHGMMVVNGKQVDVDDGSGSGVPHSPGAQPLQHEQAYQLVTDVGPSSGSHYQSGTPVIATPPPPRASVDRDLIDRPVSPPLPEDVENRGHGDENPHVASRDLGIAGSSGDGRASAAVDRGEDPEMQWILEEERRAKERKEQQEELRRLR